MENRVWQFDSSLNVKYVVTASYYREIRFVKLGSITYNLWVKGKLDRPRRGQP